MLSSIFIGGFSTSAGSEFRFGLCLYGHMVEGIDAWFKGEAPRKPA
jgi:hypothetical protein